MKDDKINKAPNCGKYLVEMDRIPRGMIVRMFLFLASL